MSFFRFLKSFDYLAPSQVLYIKGHKSYQTYIGALLSLLVFGLVFALLIYFCYKLISRENIFIAIQEESFIDEFYYNISNSLFAFKINSDIEIYENEIKFVATYHEVNLSNDLDIEKKNFEIEKCSEKNIDKSIKEVDKIQNISSFYCLVPSETGRMKSNLEKGIHSYLNLEIYLCDKNKDLSCKSEEEIVNKLNNHFLEFYLISQTHYVNNYNHKNPLLKTFVEESVNLNLGTVTNRTYFFEKISYYSDNGLVFEKKKKYKGFIFPTKTRYSTNIRKEFNKPLGGFFFSINKGQRQRYERKYQKLQEVCANIGGVLSFLNFIGSFIISAYNEQFFFYEIITGIFNPKKGAYKGCLKHSVLYPDNFNKNFINKLTNSSQMMLKQFTGNNKALNLLKSSSKKNNIEVMNKKNNDNNNNNNNINQNNLNLSYNNSNNNGNFNSPNFRKPKIMLNFPKLKFFDLLCSVCFTDNPKAKFLNDCQELVFNTLSCEDIIKNSINIEKLIQIGEFNDKEEYFDLFPIQLQSYINKDYIASSFHGSRNENGGRQINEN